MITSMKQRAGIKRAAKDLNDRVGLRAMTPAEQDEFNDYITELDEHEERLQNSVPSAGYVIGEDGFAHKAPGSAGTGGNRARFYTNSPSTYSDPDQNRDAPSFFKDLRSARFGDGEAMQRLATNQQERAAENRAIGTAAGGAGQFAPPAWLVNEFVALARPGRVTADLLNKQELPSGVSSLNLPKISGGSTTGVQQTNNTAVSNTDLTTASVSSGIVTVAGQQVVSLQLLAQSPIPFDRVILGDLAADFAKQLDLQVIAGTGANGQLRGLEHGASVGTTAYTTTTPKFVDATTSANSFYNRLVGAVTSVANARFKPATAIIMSPTRWAWCLEALDGNGRPMILTQGGSFNAAGVSENPVAEGAAGSLLNLPVYTDPNIPTNLGAATNQDEVFVLRTDDVHLWESALQMESFEATFANQASVLFRALGYSAMIGDRFGPSVNIIGGTGLVAPTL